MKVIKRLLIPPFIAVSLAACSPALESGKGFALPDGNPALGQQAFLDLQCNACHSIQDLELPSLDIAAPVSVELGGTVSGIQTYGELVTSIINPSHKLIEGYPQGEVSSDGQSFMPSMNEFMTVRQLVDLVAFLQDQYELPPPAPRPYAIYRYE